MERSKKWLFLAKIFAVPIFATINLMLAAATEIDFEYY